uniref:J domain-containing protein n=1 Tax=Kalanchoe fedtschenkoi TaxID=63787 RepID=A0A7N0UQB4_KALFE
MDASATTLLLPAVPPSSTLIDHHRVSSPGQTHHHPFPFPFKSTSTSGRITFPPKPSPVSAAAKSLAASLAPPGSPVSLYEVLGVKRNASPVEIKKAYRNLAKLCHPDSSPQSADGTEFVAIRHAYATLSDPAARALYDLSITVARHGGNLARINNGYHRGWRWETDQCW